MAYLQYSAVINAPKATVAQYFENVTHFDELVDKPFGLKLTSAYSPMKKGIEYEFEFTQFGLSQIWAIRITDYKKHSHWKNRQSVGFFDYWEHTCAFEEHGDDSTLITHTMDYNLPLGLVGRLLDDLYFKKTLESLFDKAHKKMNAILEKQVTKSPAKKKTTKKKKKKTSAKEKPLARTKG